MNCDRCNEPMIEIEHDGEQLTGCIDCNCWKGSRSAFIVDLSIEDIQALRGGERLTGCPTCNRWQDSNGKWCRLAHDDIVVLRALKAAKPEMKDLETG